MGRFSVLVVPKLRKSFVKAASYLRLKSHDAILIPIPRTLQTLIEDYALGAPYELFVEKLKLSKLVSEPLAPWIHIFEPLFRVLREIKHTHQLLNIFCYKDPAYEEKSTQIAVEISMLTFNTASTGKIDLDVWRRLLESKLLAEAEAFQQEASFIFGLAESYSDTVCISGIRGGAVFKRLGSLGRDVQLAYIDLPYFFTPLEILRNEIQLESRRGRLTNHRMEELIHEHIRYVRECILRSSDLDEAYLRWVAMYRSRFVSEGIVQNA